MSGYSSCGDGGGGAGGERLASGGSCYSWSLWAEFLTHFCVLLSELPQQPTLSQQPLPMPLSQVWYFHTLVRSLEDGTKAQR